MLTQLIGSYHRNRRSCIGCSHAVVKYSESHSTLETLRFWWRRCRRQHKGLPLPSFALGFAAIVLAALAVAFSGWSDDEAECIMLPFTFCVGMGIDAMDDEIERRQ